MAEKQKNQRPKREKDWRPPVEEIQARDERAEGNGEYGRQVGVLHPKTAEAEDGIERTGVKTSFWQRVKCRLSKLFSDPTKT